MISYFYFQGSTLFPSSFLARDLREWFFLRILFNSLLPISESRLLTDVLPFGGNSLPSECILKFPSFRTSARSSLPPLELDLLASFAFVLLIPKYGSTPMILELGESTLCPLLGSGLCLCVFPPSSFIPRALE